MDADLRPLDALIEQLEKLDSVGVQIATEARGDVEAAARATAAAGTTPSGEAWAPKKDGGGRPLAHAASAITAIVSGGSRAVIALVLRGHYVVHHFGRAKSKGGGGLPKRQILPSSDALPPAITNAVQAAAERVLARVMGGRR